MGLCTCREEPTRPFEDAEAFFEKLVIPDPRGGQQVLNEKSAQAVLVLKPSDPFLQGSPRQSWTFSFV